ncbi:MAG: Na+/H+ antiporter subunit E [Methanoregulaceae archaeon]|nr:Na+/H+ antiporter subunit E [Methanoregulaceae archaeon]
MHKPRPPRGDPVIAFFLTFLLSLFIYLLFTAGSGNVGLWSVSELTAGVALSLVTAAIARKFLCRAGNYRMANPLRFLLIPVYVIGPFFIEVIKANLDVAYRVITMRIRPGIIRVSSDLKTDLGIFMLANSITLTPGTITVDIDETTHDLFIHNINVGAGVEDKTVIRDHELFSIVDLPKWIRRIAE